MPSHPPKIIKCSRKVSFIKPSVLLKFSKLANIPKKQSINLNSAAIFRCFTSTILVAKRRKENIKVLQLSLKASASAHLLMPSEQFEVFG